jgi:hypothetical protein
VYYINSSFQKKNLANYPKFVGKFLHTVSYFTHSHSLGYLSEHANGADFWAWAGNLPASNYSLNLAEINPTDARVWDISALDAPKLLEIGEHTRDLGLSNDMKLAIETRDRCGVWSMATVKATEHQENKQPSTVNGISSIHYCSFSTFIVLFTIMIIYF